MSESIILFGAGSAGRYALKHLRAQGIEPVAFADNDSLKQGTEIDGVPVYSPEECNLRFPDAVWVATAISRPAATEIRAHLNLIEVATKPLWECLPVFHGLPPQGIRDSLFPFVGDVESKLVFNDQCIFRRNPDYAEQPSPSPISKLYFPDFITRLDSEVFIDAGACNGDTVRDFMKRWPKFKSIVAFEPDQNNFNDMCNEVDNSDGKITMLRMALSDYEGYTQFTANGDYSSHLGYGEEKVRVTTLDKILGDVVPTYIKADVEGSELELLWGARNMLKQHKPVLAICAYHTSDHLWEIPLLIHAINPEYSLHLRRYAEGAFELVWYAVPPERVREPQPWSDISYSDNHTG